MPDVKVFGGGDSGEEPGDGSVALESSTVEQVVVGEESVDAEVAVVSLMVCWWNLLKTFSAYSEGGGKPDA